MLNKISKNSFFLLIVMVFAAYGQENAQPLSIKPLKEAYAGKFLIGTANDLRGLSEAELENIKTHYNILTPENCMKPQPIHPSEHKYNFAIADSLVNWCTKMVSKCGDIP